MSTTDDDCAVKIAVRQRPLREIFQDTDVPLPISYHTSNSNIIIADERPFAFDHVLPQNVTQREVFELLVMPLVNKVLEGFNCTALAYGQTGTGKSFTMGLNPESFEGEDMGVIPRCLQEILEQKQDLHLKYGIRGSFIEIYNEKVYDLLGENPSEPIIARGYKYTGGNRKPITNIHDAYTLLVQGTKNRHVRPTKMNTQSSRSHAIFTIYVENIDANKITQSCLNLVDLAGSEGVRRTGHQGVALSEGVHINQGLLSIGKVLQAITHGYKVIPYRDSVLSSVLQDSLNPNSYFTLLACISPHREDLSETLSTLRFAQSAKNLKNNPQLNLKLMELKKGKTPYKMSQIASNKRSMATPTPYKRPFSLTNSKQSSGTKKPTYHGNTFCTPSKKDRKDHLKLSQTVVGLTPKEKQKIGSVLMPVSKVAPFSVGLHERESLMSRYNDTSLESRPSLMSLNMSTSTAIESRPTSSSRNISPIVRRCMEEMQNTMTSSVLRVLESIKNTNTPSISSKESCPETLAEQKLRNIIRQELLTITRANDVNDQRVTESGVRCELFRSSSPIFKIPKIPGVRPLTDSYTSQMSISFQNESISHEEATVLPKPLRRSLRVSLSVNSFCADNSVALPPRRSKRLSSITEYNKNKRRSIRVASHKEEPQNVVKKRTKSTKGNKSTKTNNIVNNTVIAGYFDEEKENTRRSTKSALEKHQKAILDMLNNASMKELQLLPQIGLKTAFQIITQRTLHGKFKNFTQVGKLPIWRGQAFERFKAANNIIS